MFCSPPPTESWITKKLRESILVERFSATSTESQNLSSNKLYTKDDIFSTRENFFKHNGLSIGGSNNSSSPNKRIDSNFDVYNCSIKKNKGDNTPRELNSSKESDYIKVQNSEMLEEDEFIKRFKKKNKMEGSGYVKSIDNIRRSNYDTTEKESIIIIMKIKRRKIRQIRKDQISWIYFLNQIIRVKKIYK